MNKIIRKFFKNYKLIFTDFELLETIQSEYYSKYLENMKETSKDKNHTGFYIPIDCDYIASIMNADAEIVFNRLYFHLNNKYQYKKDDRNVYLFALEVAKTKHCINYPYLCSIFAHEKEKREKENISLILSIIAIIISLLPYIVALIT